jgi:hypothetical protein
MAQEPSSRDLLDAVKQQESGGRRYDKSGKLLEGPPTKYGTAKGEMQVLDMTNKDPGFGVRPAKDDSPDERARVGRDYLAAMKKRYGNTETALIAYNWGPGNTDKWLKAGANPAKLPKETQRYVANITASLGGTKVASAAPKPKAVKPGAVVGGKTAVELLPLFSQLGPSYQAAMAVSMLADEAEKEGKDEDAPSESEKMLAAMPSQPAAAIDLEFRYRSPFPEVQAQAAPVKRGPLPLLRPVRMAEGGDPQMENKAVPFEGADLPVYRSAKELKAYTEALNPGVKVVTDDLGVGTRGKMTPSRPDILELDYRLTPAEREITTLHELEHSMDARGGDMYGRPNFALMGGMDNNYRAYHLMGNDWGPVTETVKNMVDNREKLEKFFGRPLDNAYFNKQFYNSVKEVQSPSALFSEQLASLSALEQTTGKFLTQDPEMRELFPNTRMMAVFDALTGPRQTRMDARDLPPHTPVPSYTYETNPALRFIKKALTGENEYGTSSRPFPIKRANGGEVDYFQDPMGAPSAPVTQDTLAKGRDFKAADALRILKEGGKDVGRNLRAIGQGVLEIPYNFFGGAADIGNMVLTPFGLGSAEPFLGSAQLKRLALERGIRQAPPTDPRDLGYYMMGELGASALSPAGVVGGGVQAADKVGEAAKMLKKVPPAPAKATTQTVAPVEPRPVAPAPVLREAPAAPVRQAEPLPAPPAEVAVPQEMLPPPPAMTALPEAPPVAAPMQVGVPADRPFVGRLDAFVDTIKNPVQLGQLKGQLKGKFRDYDIERVERAFAGMDDKTKLTPDQIKQALAGTHSPSKWISETLPPKAGEYSQTADNVWGKELGTTNLYLEQPAKKEVLFNTYDELKDALTQFEKNSAAQPTVLGLEKIKKALNDQNIEEVVGTELVAKLKSNFNKAEKNIRLVDKYDNQIYNIKMGFTRPVLYKTGELSVKYQTDNQPFFKYQQEFMDNLVTKAQERLIQQGGITPVTAKTNAMNEVYNSPNFTQTHRQSEIYAMKKVQELALADARNLGIDSPNLALVDWTGYETGISSYPTATTAFTKSVDDVLEPSIVTLHEANKQVQRLLSDDIKQFSKVLKNEGAYRPDRHGSIAPGPHPIGFTRFSEHETTVPGMGTIEGRHFHELQSDLSKDMRTKGATFGSAAKDQAEYDKLINQIKQTRDPILDELQVLEQEKIKGINSGQLSNTRYQEIEERQKTLRKIFAAEIKPLEKRVNILTNRRYENPTYSLEEPFAGFETNQMVRQQLLMKNAIQAAMRDGKRFATFPGKESDQPQLYVGKVLPNLKQIIKDLGGEKAGFELRHGASKIELPPDKKGNPITAIGVVWSPEAAARIVEKGVPFAKGGMVERQSADTRRYL